MNTGTNEINKYIPRNVHTYIYTTYLMLVYVCTLLGSICCNICLDGRTIVVLEECLPNQNQLL